LKKENEVVRKEVLKTVDSNKINGFENKALDVMIDENDETTKSGLSHEGTASTEGISDLGSTSSTAIHNSSNFNSNKKLKYLIIDLKRCSFIDNDGCKLLKELFEDLNFIGVRTLIAESEYSVYKTLLNSGFDKILEKSKCVRVFFVSIKAAVSYANSRIFYTETCKF